MGSVGREELVQGPSGREEKILVSVRLRPLNEKEIARNDVSDWECVTDNSLVYKNNLTLPERSMYPAAYTFDRVFRCDCSTRQVYEEGAKEVALSVVSGINSSIFAYGQTSSGKTYTMSGITEYSIADIYDYIQSHNDRKFFLKFSAMEIYNESVRDLLSADSTPLRLLDDPERGTIVEKLTEETLGDWNHLKELLSFCKAQRQIGETALNETSSRSHQIIRLTIESSGRELLSNDHSSTLTATVNFVDLAGSERASQSLSAGSRLKEGCHINRSLLTLGTVIRKLSKGRNGHVPFRDSKLTRILQASLAGNARTAIICTMSPARTHVEQSRNTLLFASCAKEVTTNAQVNIVMSDKALVKHLQRELARLEAELRNSGTTVTSDSAALLREKDLQIEELTKEMSKLILQRDVAQSQVEDLLRVAGDDESSTSSPALDRHYPKLQVRKTWVDESLSDMSAESFEASLNSDRYSRASSGDLYLHFPYSEEASLHSGSGISPGLLVTNPGIECNEWDEIDGSTEENPEDICKEVRCIEIEQSSMSRRVKSNASFSEANTEVSGITMVENGNKADQDFAYLALKEDAELSSFQPGYALPSPDKASPGVLQIGTSGSRGLKLSKNILTSYSSSWFEKIEKNENTPQNMLEKQMEKENMPLNMLEIDIEKNENVPPKILEKEIQKMENTPSNALETERANNENTPPDVLEKDFQRPKGIQSKLSALNFDPDNADNIILWREGSQTSTTSVSVDELEATDTRTSTDKDIACIDTFVDGMKEMVKLQFEKQFAESATPEAEKKADKPVKEVKDIGLDPMQDDPGSSVNWPSKFKSLQGDIIALWDSCNVSLVHRTYFFLLFKGDPTDDVYLEVELRRLSFLKDAFSRGNQALEDGRTLTPASSMKALRRERGMLSKRMNKLSQQHRESLYQKWGIGLNTRNRRLQLTCLLWTNTKDMDHITESANIVAKLVGFIDPGKVSKEMFGINFTLQTTSRRSFRW